MTRLTLADAQREISTLGPDPHVRTVEALRDRERRAARRVAQAAESIDEHATLEDQVRLDEAVSDYKRADSDATDVPQIILKSEPEIYTPDGEFGFLNDMVLASIPTSSPMHVAARERIERHKRRTEIEQRTTRTSDAFGGVVVPQFLVDFAAGPVRAGDPFLRALTVQPLPAEGVSLSIPRATTSSGPVATVQATEGTDANEVDPAYVDITRKITTVSAKLDTSVQRLDRMGPLGERFVYSDLRAAVDDELDNQLLNGDGTSGALLGVRTAAATSVTWTQASPRRDQFLGRIARVASDLAGVRKQPPDVVVLHSRRWFWALSGTVSTGTDGASVGMQIDSRPVHGTPFVGRIGSLGVVIDYHIPTSLGTNEDTAVLVRSSDLVLAAEDAARVSVDSQTGSNTVSVTLVGHRFAWFAPDRFRGTSVGLLVGSGLITPGAY